jgi:hypothetical protein
LQQSFEQQAAAFLLQHDGAAVLSDDVLAMPAAISPAATAKPPNNLINMRNLLSG